MISHASPVRIYEGTRTCSWCVKKTILAFRSLLPNAESISTIDAKSIKSTEWMSSTKILIIPGGAAGPYHEALGDQGMRNIKQFVHSGRTLVGICAGAYFAAAKSIFAVDTKGEVKGEHLGLFPGEAHGPFYNDFDYLDKSMRYPIISCFDSTSRVVLVHGGGWFIDTEKYQNVSVLARYEFQECGRAAVIRIKYGEGIVLASHVHFEDPAVWSGWRKFIFSELEHTGCLVYSDGQTMPNEVNYATSNQTRS